MASKNKITTSSTAEYFSKNLQQVGFSSATKAVLTTLKEAVDNALDACEDGGILPELSVEISKVGAGSHKNTDQIRVKVEDNGPGIAADDLSKVFGEYLASSKFGRGRCSRGQQGIGISAATTWAQLTSAQGAVVISKTKDMRKAVRATVEVDIKHNKGVLKGKETIDWDRPHGVSVEFFIDGRIQLNGEAGLLNYLNGTALVNPHLTMRYKVPVAASEADKLPEWQVIERVTDQVPHIPNATEPHPHTMKLGEFIAHSHLFGRTRVDAWLKKGFSRVHEGTLKELKANGLKPAYLSRSVDAMKENEFKELFRVIQNTQLMAPSTKSVLAIGETTLSKSVYRLGTVDFFAVVTRKPTVCDFKPVLVEVAVARLRDQVADPDSQASVLRFANRVPLQFDKSSCAIVHAIETVNWRAYELAQPKNSIPLGPYVIAVSVVSPFIKFKNASKETIDASDELVEEIRRALIQAGQRLSRHIRREGRANELEQKLRHIEQFCPILVEGLCRITSAPATRKKRAEDGLVKILGRDAKEAKQDFEAADAIVIQAEQAKAEGKKTEGKKPEGKKATKGKGGGGEAALEASAQETPEAMTEPAGTTDTETWQ
jgi:DNA topoisomerase-6 subunit B